MSEDPLLGSPVLWGLEEFIVRRLCIRLQLVPLLHQLPLVSRVLHGTTQQSVFLLRDVWRERLVSILLSQQTLSKSSIEHCSAV